MDLIEDAKEVIRRESRMLEQVAEQLGKSFADAVDLLVGCQGHVITSGVGTTGMIARRFAHLLCNVGCPALFLHAGDSLHGSSGAIRPEDVLFLLTKSGNTTETCMLAKLVVERNTPIITLTANPDSTVGRLSTVIIKVETEKEVDPYEGLMSVGSTLAAGAVCDALVFAVMWAKGTPQQQFVEGHPGGVISASKKNA